jgi:hypothetical protein
MTRYLLLSKQLWVCWCGALSLTIGCVCRLQLLLALASVVILGSESCGTRNHILMSHIRDFPFRRLLRLAGLQWKYSTPTPHGKQKQKLTAMAAGTCYIASALTTQKTPLLTVPPLFHGHVVWRWLCYCCMFTKLLPSNGHVYRAVPY